MKRDGQLLPWPLNLLNPNSCKTFWIYKGTARTFVRLYLYLWVPLGQGRKQDISWKGIQTKARIHEEEVEYLNMFLLLSSCPHSWPYPYFLHGCQLHAVRENLPSRVTDRIKNLTVIFTLPQSIQNKTNKMLEFSNVKPVCELHVLSSKHCSNATAYACVCVFWCFKSMSDCMQNIWWVLCHYDGTA